MQFQALENPKSSIIVHHKLMHILQLHSPLSHSVIDVYYGSDINLANVYHTDGCAACAMIAGPIQPISA